MSQVLVWSERGEAPGVIGWHDCTQAAALMVLVAAGKTDFPLGIYTIAERNELEKFDTRPDNTGALLSDIDLAVERRYAVQLRRLQIGARDGLVDELSRPGRAYLLTGSLGNYPAGHKLRRWQPAFTGGHALTVIPRADGQVLWLDPLATNRYPGDVVDPATAAAFAWTNWEGRYLGVGELASMPDASVAPPPLENPMLNFKTEAWRVGPGGAIYRNGVDGGRIGTLPAGTALTTIGETLDGKHRQGLVTVNQVDRLVMFARADLVPFVQGGDPEFNAGVRALLVARDIPDTEADFKRRAIAAIGAL